MTETTKKNAYFRVYAGLNDFLPLRKRQKSFAFRFWGAPSLKNTIHSLNIPHTEVALVLANGVPSPFSYQLRAEDRIALYPSFTLPEITGINKQEISRLCDFKFVVDANAGKLARFLRMLGFDALYNNRYHDDEIIRISNEENRLILTRDLGILKNNNAVYGYFLRTQNPRLQLQEVVQRFDLMSQSKPFSRCMECNGVLTAIARHLVEKSLDEETTRFFNEFFRCGSCRKIYWKGSHYERMLKAVNRL